MSYIHAGPPAIKLSASEELRKEANALALRILGECEKQGRSVALVRLMAERLVSLAEYSANVSDYSRSFTVPEELRNA